MVKETRKLEDFRRQQDIGSWRSFESYNARWNEA